ncbi:LuxR C-terminal-related transcriptional regulator [Pseudohongiella sp. O18]|uniref:LuxR C-terminal-related transcriptional regulator n=1 Tax=Pseudohongiella sp. O18 TaxID=2904248 RepID=UPI001F011748|nr:LuxR C-terminal-related transcriptional regulator [Pseudohongiella sp. O18]
MHLVLNTEAANRLPRREGAALLHAAEGCSIKASARKMNCGTENVKSARNNLFWKLDAPNITAAVAEGFRRGYLKYIPAIALCFLTLLGGGDEQMRYNRVARTVRIVRIREAS